MDLSDFKLKLITGAAILATAWAWILTNYGAFLNGLPSWAQFLLVTGTVYAVPAFIVAKNGDSTPRKFIGNLFLIASADLLIPPLAVGFDGAVNSTALLSGSSIDVLLASAYQFLGVSGPLLFLAVYPLSFLVLIVLADVLLTSSELRKSIKN